MPRNRITFALRAAAALPMLAMAIAVAQPPAQPPPAPSEAAQRQIAENNKLPDPPGTGRFAALKEEVASLPKHVIYRPANLAALGGQKLGVVAWGNGGCSDDGASSRFHLLEIASHGYRRDRERPSLERSRRAARRAAPGGAARSAAAGAHRRRGSHRRARLGARREPALGQPVLRAHRSQASRAVGLELRRATGARGCEGSRA